MAWTRMRHKRQITLPVEILEALHVEEGDEIEFKLTPDGRVLTTGLKKIPTARHGSGLRRGRQESGKPPLNLLAARAKHFETPEDFLKSMTD